MTKFFTLSLNLVLDTLPKKTFGKNHFGALVVNIKDGVLWKDTLVSLLFIFKSSYPLMFTFGGKKYFQNSESQGNAFILSWVQVVALLIVKRIIFKKVKIITFIQILNAHMSKGVFNLLNEGTRHMLLQIQRKNQRVTNFYGVKEC